MSWHWREALIGFQGRNRPIFRNSLFFQASHEGRDQCSIFGKSRLISSPYVLSMLCKTLESNKSLCCYRREYGR